MIEPLRQPKSAPLPDVSPEQKQRAASNPASSVWVNASAGSGKTTVLTNRVTRLLLEGVKPEKILCLTFTRAAAAEMAIRVTEKLSAWATCDDNALSQSLSELQGYAPTPDQMLAARRLFASVLSCPGGMRIRTIHAFCQEILRRFPIEAGLPPHFTVIEEDDAHALQEAVKLELLMRAAEEEPLGNALSYLINELGERGFTAAMQDILTERTHIAASLAKTGSHKNLIARIRSELSLEADETYETILAAALHKSRLPEADLKQAGIWLTEASKAYAPRGQKMLAWLALSASDRLARFDEYCRCFFTGDGEIYSKFANKELLTKYPDLENILSKEAIRLQSLMERLEAATIVETTSCVIAFGQELIREYQKQKRLRAVLDYDDLIIHADELLRRPGIAPWILYKLDGGLDHILVDEAQDTSRGQWSIVAALADEFFAGFSARSDLNRTLFVVGDEKQSIFSFQKADPEAFADMRAFFSERITDAEKSYTEVPMRTSFRSAPAILKAVDKVFAADTARAGVARETLQHTAFNPEKQGRVEVWDLLPAPEKEKTETGEWLLPLGYEKEHDPQAELATRIAVKIKQVLQEELPGEAHAISPGDIMILLRRRGRFADLMVRALKEQNIPVTGVDRMQLVAQLPVMDLLALLQFALLPEDDLNLATILRGPLLNFSEDQLMTLAINRETTLWRSLTAKQQEKRAFSDAFAYLSQWLNAADLTTPFALLIRILSQPCPASTVSGRQAIWSRLGPDALDPIDELLNAAQEFSHAHTPSLQNFLHWLMATESTIKRELDRGNQQVRIMTVHAAKGLEAPIVFLPDTATVPRVQDLPKFLWSKTKLPFYVACKPDAGAARSLWNAARQKQLEEYRRLLYVALTRAANRLYIGGWEPARKEPDANESWYNLVRSALEPLQEASALTKSEPQPAIAFADPELRRAKSAAKPEPERITKPLPHWINQPAPAEKTTSKSIAPSQMLDATSAATPDSAFARGRIIHRLLQSLPELSEKDRANAAVRFLANPQHHLSEIQQKEIAQEVLGLISNPAYTALFDARSRAEVPIIGNIGNQPVSGQVDRICINEDAVWIVDYKTNRPPPKNAADAPLAYRQQLAGYRAVLTEIYPAKPIRCFLLWTHGPHLMEIPENQLGNA